MPPTYTYASTNGLFSNLYYSFVRLISSLLLSKGLHSKKFPNYIHLTQIPNILIVNRIKWRSIMKKDTFTIATIQVSSILDACLELYAFPIANGERTKDRSVALVTHLNIFKKVQLLPVF